MTRALARVAFGMLGGGFIGLTPGMAQIGTLPGTNEVLERARPGYDAKGLPLGGLRLYPQMDVDLTYDDNIYSSSTLVVSDRFIALAPQLSLRSDWSRHSLTADVNARIERYDHTKTENNEQYGGKVMGRYDVTPTISVNGAGRYQHGVEQRGTAGDVLIGGEPITFRTRGGTVGAAAEAGRLNLQANVSLDRIDYDAVRVGTTRYSQAYRDHDSLVVTAQAGLLISPSVTLYGNGSYNRQNYRTGTSDGVTLDAHGFSALLGAGFEVSRLISVRGSIGYQRQSFGYAAFSTISGFTYNGAVRWNPTPLLSVGITAVRQIQQSPYLDISGIVTSTAGATVDYELLRHLLVSGGVDYQTDDYHGASRQDHRFSQRIAIRYLINRNASIAASYNHRDQRSSGDFGRRYNGNVARVTLRIQA